jgi:Tol biopolymer transport system component
MVVLLASVLLGVPAAHGAFPGVNGPIVVVLNNGNLLKLDPTTGAPTTLCTGCARDRPAVSRDGMTVAFTNFSGGGLREISINGGPITTVTGTLTGDDDPTFTADGATLVFVTGGDPDLLGKISAKGGGGRTTIPGSPGTVANPEVSPDGQTVAFINNVNDDAGPFYVETIPINGGTVTQRSVNLGGSNPVSWSPDGTKIAADASAGSCPSAPVGILLATATAATPTCLASSAAGDSIPSWSPDGAKIVVANTGQAVVLNASGTGGRTTLGTPSGFVEDYWALMCGPVGAAGSGRAGGTGGSSRGCNGGRGGR